MPFAKRTEDDAIRRLGVDTLDTSVDGEKEQLELMRKDLKYSRNEQWSDQGEVARKKLQRPAFTFNVLDRLVNNIAGDLRGSDLGIEARPVDSEGDVVLAKAYQGIARAVQYQSRSRRAFAWAGECAARLSRGYFALDVEYEHDRSMDLVPVFRRIADPFTIKRDPKAFEADGSDWEWCHHLKFYTKEAYEAAWPGKAVTDVGEAYQDQLLRRWYTFKGRVARQIERYLVSELYWKEQLTEEICLIKDPNEQSTVIVLNELQASGGRLIEDGGQLWYNLEVAPGEFRPLRVLKKRTVETHKVRKVLMSGHELLSKPFDWYTKTIPIYEVLGVEIIGDGEAQYKSAIRNGLDSQTVINAMNTSAAEAVMASVKNKVRAPFKAIQNYMAKYYKRLNDPGEMLMPFDPQPELADGGKPELVSMSPKIGPQLSNAANSLELIRWTTGMGAEGTGLESNAKSGRLFALRRDESDQNTAIFKDNLTQAVENAGVDLLEIIGLVCKGRSRLVQAVVQEEGLTPQIGLLGINGAVGPDQSRIMAKITGNKDLEKLPPEQVGSFTLRPARHAVRVVAGQNRETRRIEAQEFAGQLVQAFGNQPEVGGLIVQYILEQSDYPGGHELAEQLQELRSGQLQQQVMQQILEDPELGAQVFQALQQRLMPQGGVPVQ